MKINLLPPEIAERQRVRRRAVAVGAAGLVVIVAVVGYAFLQQQRRAAIEDDVAQQEGVNAQLSQEIAALQEFELLQQELAASRGELDTLLVNEVLWSGLLRDVSLVIPGEAWLTSMTGSVATPETAVIDETGAPADTGLIGSITFQGFAFDHRVVALWLARLEEIEGFVNPWLQTSELTTLEARQVAQFLSSVDLSSSAAVPRGTGAA